MKKIILVLCIMILSGCAVVQTPLSGILFTGVNAPVTATESPSYSKHGEARAVSILGLVAVGDASINAAAKAGGITKIHHVDYKAASVLGVFASYTVHVYGD